MDVGMNTNNERNRRAVEAFVVFVFAGALFALVLWRWISRQ